MNCPHCQTSCEPQRTRYQCPQCSFQVKVPTQLVEQNIDILQELLQTHGNSLYLDPNKFQELLENRMSTDQGMLRLMCQLLQNHCGEEILKLTALDSLEFFEKREEIVQDMKNSTIFMEEKIRAGLFILTRPLDPNFVQQGKAQSTAETEEPQATDTPVEAKREASSQVVKSKENLPPSYEISPEEKKIVNSLEQNLSGSPSLFTADLVKDKLALLKKEFPKSPGVPYYEEKVANALKSWGAGASEAISELLSEKEEFEYKLQRLEYAEDFFQELNVELIQQLPQEPVYQKLSTIMELAPKTYVEELFYQELKPYLEYLRREAKIDFPNYDADKSNFSCQNFNGRKVKRKVDNLADLLYLSHNLRIPQGCMRDDLMYMECASLFKYAPFPFSFLLRKYIVEKTRFQFLDYENRLEDKDYDSEGRGIWALSRGEYILHAEKVLQNKDLDYPSMLTIYKRKLHIENLNRLVRNTSYTNDNALDNLEKEERDMEGKWHKNKRFVPMIPIQSLETRPEAPRNYLLPSDFVIEQVNRDNVVYNRLVSYVGPSLPPDTILFIPKNVHIIGDTAFVKANTFTMVNIPSSVCIIEDKAFEGLPIEVLFFSMFQEFCGLDRIPERAFADCKKLRWVEFHPNIRLIGPYAFGGCTSLEYVTLPEKLEELEGIFSEGSFADCKNLREVGIHAHCKPAPKSFVGTLYYQNTYSRL